eukprot:IDg11134t1
MVRCACAGEMRRVAHDYYTDARRRWRSAVMGGAQRHAARRGKRRHGVGNARARAPARARSRRCVKQRTRLPVHSSRPANFTPPHRCAANPPRIARALFRARRSGGDHVGLSIHLQYEIKAHLSVSIASVAWDGASWCESRPLAGGGRREEGGGKRGGGRRKAGGGMLPRHEPLLSPRALYFSGVLVCRPAHRSSVRVCAGERLDMEPQMRVLLCVHARTEAQRGA